MRLTLEVPVIAIVLLAGPITAHAATDGIIDVNRPPMSLAALLETEAGPIGSARTFAEERRREALHDAGLAWGAQSGLAHETFEIRQRLLRLEAALDSIYRFDALMIREAGFTVMPPVMVETGSAFRREAAGRKAITAGRILRIVEPARIVSRAPDWRAYLIRSWSRPVPPPDVLFPRDDEERALWQQALTTGWHEGQRLARDILDADLDRLNRDFLGIVAWRVLHARQMVSAPVLEVSRRAVNGGGRQMSLAEVIIGIDDDARLNPVIGDWVPKEEAQP